MCSCVVSRLLEIDFIPFSDACLLVSVFKCQSIVHRGRSIAHCRRSQSRCVRGGVLFIDTAVRALLRWIVPVKRICVFIFVTFCEAPDRVLVADAPNQNHWCSLQDLPCTTGPPAPSIALDRVRGCWSGSIVSARFIDSGLDDSPWIDLVFNCSYFHSQRGPHREASYPPPFSRPQAPSRYD